MYKKSNFQCPKLLISKKFFGMISVILLTLNLTVSAQSAPSNSARSSNSSSLISTSSGLQYQQIRSGNGLKPKLDDMVTIHYIFKLEDGSEIDNSYSSNRPLETRVSDLIKGLQEGVQLMNQGSKFRFIIPSALAYGEDGAGGGKIPPNATIVYDIELLKMESQNKIIPENDDAPIITSAGIKDQKAKMAKSDNKKNQEDLDNVTKAQNELYGKKRESLVKAQELGNAILKILAAAPKDFDPIRGELIDTGRSKGRYKGLVNMSSTNSPSVIPANGSYYVLSVLNDVEKSALSPSAVLTMKVIKRAMGEGTVEKEEPSKFSTIIYQYRNSNRTEWIEMVIHPFGHLTVFIYKK